MEREFLISECNDENILTMARELSAIGVKVGIDKYYKADKGSPFFKIPKPYAKEKDGDPDEMYVFIDVDDTPTGIEYSTYITFSQDHFADARECAEVVAGLMDESIAEVAYVSEGFSVSALMHYSGSDSDAINAFGKAAFDVLNSLSGVGDLCGGHMHLPLAESVTRSFVYCSSDGFMIDGIKSYFAVAVLAKHPEFYVMEQY